MKLTHTKTLVVELIPSFRLSWFVDGPLIFTMHWFNHALYLRNAPPTP